MLQASIEALLRGEAALLPDGMAAALPPALPSLAFTAAATEPEDNILRLPASELRAWLPAWAASKGDCASQGAGNAFNLHRSCNNRHSSQSLSQSVPARCWSCLWHRKNCTGNSQGSGSDPQTKVLSLICGPRADAKAPPVPPIAAPLPRQQLQS